jgi:putative hydrolase of the HAD superfamily
MTRPLRAVLFDAGNTLIFLDHDRLAAEVGAATGLALTGERIRRTAPAAARALERKERLSDRERATRYLELLFLHAGVPGASLPQVRDALFAMHQVRHLWSWIHPETPRALERIRAVGVPMGVVSNSDGRVEEALRAAGIRDSFDVVIDSQIVGVEKPDPSIFRHALDALAVAPGEALYVGDIYEVDVVGARAAGLDVMLVDPDGRNAGRDVQTCPSVAAVVAAREIEGRQPAAALP